MATIFHYAGILTELSQALQNVHDASDWHEATGDAKTFDEQSRLSNERGNIRAAMGRLLGAYRSLKGRLDDVLIDLIPVEHQQQTAQATKIARVITETDESHLPDDLRSGSGASTDISS